MLCVFAVVTTPLPSPPPIASAVGEYNRRISKDSANRMSVSQDHTVPVVWHRDGPIAGTFEILLLYRYTVTSWRPLDDAVDRTTRHHVSRRLPRRHIDERSDLF